eukprot:CAMPEP_0182919068 /NCGR_PEP_ID=MMETSP0105_2-20130417/2443_1 /TAXON_ID=81532 ORGANISM="Acanthoeca-like sp., Strain 10tr" /NCGR_SAMPLE_ID=MMETSP0105_2 /ASSEMBLY_ACC=CAM_ASM_000205 /LENGTH=92 /DNA_ID=CAMNT_0025056193 /DNA_START=624 /DNA_END=903 /DNA_ORIENTATION=+
MRRASPWVGRGGSPRDLEPREKAECEGDGGFRECRHANSGGVDDRGAHADPSSPLWTAGPPPHKRAAKRFCVADESGGVKFEMGDDESIDRG